MFIDNSFTIKQMSVLNYLFIVLIQRDDENRDERTVLVLWKSLVQVWMLTRTDCDWSVYVTVTSLFSDYWIAQYDTWIELHSTENTDKWTFVAIRLQSWTPFSFTKVPVQVCFLAENFHSWTPIPMSLQGFRTMYCTVLMSRTVPSMQDMADGHDVTKALEGHRYRPFKCENFS